MKKVGWIERMSTGDFIATSIYVRLAIYDSELGQIAETLRNHDDSHWRVIISGRMRKRLKPPGMASTNPWTVHTRMDHPARARFELARWLENEAEWLE